MENTEENNQNTKIPVIVILGTTGVGKLNVVECGF